MLTFAKHTIRRFLPSNVFARHVSILAGGSGVAQVLTVLTSPVFTRLYTPEDFGLAAVFVALLGLLLVVSTLSYEFAIPIPETDEDAISVVALCILNVLAVSLATLFFSLAFGSYICDALGVSLLSPYLWLLQPAVLLGGVYVTLTYWATRTKQFPIIATTRLWQTLGLIITKALLFKSGILGLLVSQIVGQGIGLSSLGKLLLVGTNKSTPSWSNITRMAVRYRRFPIYSTGAGLLNVAGIQAPALTLVAIFGPAATGFFALATSVLQVPMSLVGTAIAQVFFANASHSHRSGTLGRDVSTLHDKLAKLALPPLVLLAIIGPFLFELVFGSSWRQAGEFARWMVPWSYFAFVSSPLSSIFSILEKQSSGLLFQGMMLALRIGAITTGLWLHDLDLTIILYATASATSYLGLLVWMYYLTERSPSELILPTLTALLIGLVCSSPIIVLLLLGTQSKTLLAISAILSLIAISLHYFLMFRRAV